MLIGTYFVQRDGTGKLAIHGTKAYTTQLKIAASCARFKQAAGQRALKSTDTCMLARMSLSLAPLIRPGEEDEQGQAGPSLSPPTHDEKPKNFFD